MATDIIARGMAAGVVSQVSADKQAVSEDRAAVESAKTEVLNVAESIPEDYSTLSANVGELKSDLGELIDNNFDYKLNYNPNNLLYSKSWSPSSPLTHNICQYSGVIKSIKYKSTSVGKLEVYVASVKEGNDVAKYSKYITRSTNVFDIIDGDNDIDCEIPICKGDLIAYLPIDGATILYVNDESGLPTYQLINGQLSLNTDINRCYSISFTISCKMKYVDDINNINNHMNVNNLMGMNFDVLYPVDFANHNYLTISTSDGSIFESDSESYIGLYDSNKEFLGTYRLNNSKSYRHISLTDEQKNTVKYIKWYNQLPSVDCMVNYGVDSLPYEKYFKSANELSENVDKFLDGELSYIGENSLVDKCTEFANLFYGDYVIEGKNAPTNTDSFIFFTDPHTLSNNDWVDSTKKLIKSVKDYYDSTPTSFIMCGGDWLGNSDLPSVACYKLGIIKGFMNKFFRRNYMLVGNHDTNYQGKATESSETYTTRLSDDAISNIWFEGKKAYYSFRTEHTTFYCLNTGIENQYLGDCNNYFMEQVKWFANCLTQDNSEHIVIFSHILYTDENNQQMSKQALDVAKKYNSRSVKSIDNCNYDFSNSTGKIELYIAGHNHMDTNGMTSYDIPYITTKKAYENNTTTFDLIQIDYDKRLVNCIRVGNGTSRKISLDDGSLLN